MKPKVLLIDDDHQLLAQIRWVLGSDYEVITATNETDGLKAFASEQPAVAVVDLSLNRLNLLDLGGLRLIEQFLRSEPATRVIVITGNDDDANALRAVRLGAYDYYSKPVRLAELKIMIQRALEVYRIHQRLYGNQGTGKYDYDRHLSGETPPSTGESRADSLPLSNEVNLKLAKQAIELEFVKKALAKNNGVVSRAARELGISRVNLYELIQKHDIHVQEFKASRPRPGR